MSPPPSQPLRCWDGGGFIRAAIGSVPEAVGLRKDEEQNVRRIGPFAVGGETPVAGRVRGGRERGELGKQWT